MTDLNNVILLITRSHLSVAKASSSFNHVDTFAPTYATPTFTTEALSCYSSTTAFNDCFSGLTPYTAIANSYLMG